MELSKQVISLELAKKLKELGVKQESLWWWIMTNITTSGYDIISKHNKEFQNYQAPYILICATFTVAELGKMLPHYYITLCKGDVWSCYTANYTTDLKYLALDHLGIADKSEANARAKMLCWLIENKKLEVKQ